MPLFVLTAQDKPDSVALRVQVRDEHLAYLAAGPVQVKLAGPFLDAAGAPAGSLLIVEAPDQAAAAAFQQSDPYAKAGLFAATELRPWRLSVGQLG